MKIKRILATLVIATLFISCKDNVNIDDVKYETPFIYYDGGLLTGSATTLYENGKIHKIINSNKGKIENQTHFNQQGDTIATMYYMEDGSFSKYVDKTIKNNIVEFEECLELDVERARCIGSRNIPKFEYRLARLQDLWIKRKGLQEKLKNDALGDTYLAFEGSTRMGRVPGNTKMYLLGGVSYPSYYNKQPEGPFNISYIAFTVRYGSYGEKSYSEKGSVEFKQPLFSGIDEYNEYSNYGTVFHGRYSSIDESSSQGLFFTAEKKYVFSDNPDGNFHSITLTINNEYASYQSKMIFYDRDKTEEENGLLVNDIWNGTKIESQPGYSFHNFNLEWHHLHNDEVAQAYSEKKLIDYMSKNDSKVYTDTLVLGDYSLYDQNFTISDLDKKRYYYISTFYMTLEKYASVFENHIGASLPFDLNDFDEHKEEVYEIEYIKRNWVENYYGDDEGDAGPNEGKFITKMTLIE
tara:strand:- start:139 stop:1536 length:1398 start_codon:yes stop_codon:yes gene_type:complete